MSADRELHAETVIEADPATVWAALTDLRLMAEGSPELITMIPLKRGGLRLGQTYIGLNRRKAVVWTTRNVVSAYEPERLLAWDTTTVGVRWVYELSPEGTGTRLVHRRPVPHGLTMISKVAAPLLLGGSESHADELEAGMAQTLARIKRAAEAGA